MTEAVPNGGAPAPDANAGQQAQAAPNTAPEQRAGESAPSPDAHETGEGEHQPKLKGVQRRLDELTRNWRSTERDRDYWRELAMRQQSPPQQQQAPAEQEREKTLKDFNYDDAAFMRYASERIRATASAEAKAAAERYRAEQEAVSRRAKFDERLAAFGKSAEDFDEVVSWMESKSAPISEGMADFLMDSEEAGLVLQYLHNNDDEVAKLYRMSPAKAGRELTKLEDRLVAERKKAAEKPVSQAPPPPPKVDGSSEGSASVDPSTADSDKLSDADWARAREKQLERRRNR